jgi:hypothetical protein
LQGIRLQHQNQLKDSQHAQSKDTKVIDPKVRDALSTQSTTNCPEK